MTTEPLFSIVTPVYNPPIEVLESTIHSVLDQTCDDWELILVDDLSPDPHVRQSLRRAAERDERIRVIERETNGHIVAASNDGINAARGTFIALLDHDDLLVPRALASMKAAIEREPEVDYLYSDEDKVDADGRRYDRFLKPEWSPERLRGQMYTGHLSVLRTSVVRDVGGFHEGFDGSQDHDLVLRVTERARKVVHVSQVLYHWRVVPGSAAGDADAKPYAWVAGRKAVQAHVDRMGIPATVEFGSVTGTYRIDRSLDPGVRVSVVIPTRGSEGFVWGQRRCFVVEAVRSLLRYGGHDNVEIIVVYDESTPEAVLEQLQVVAGDSLNLVLYTKPFNFSEKCNLGVLASDGDVVLLLNDDVELTSEGFLTQLVAPLLEDGVGMTGARLLFSDSTVQHAGLAFFANNLIHMFRQVPDTDPGPFAAMTVSRECSGLTGACVALKRSTYEEVGGMTETLPFNFNDVDFSFKIHRAGYRMVWVANTMAYHFESQTREPVMHDWEYRIIKERWETPEQDLYMPTYGAAEAAALRRRNRRTQEARHAGR